jgi:hypothetical protein
MKFLSISVALLIASKVKEALGSSGKLWEALGSSGNVDRNAAERGTEIEKRS